jgi:hypothetical protein
MTRQNRDRQKCLFFTSQIGYRPTNMSNGDEPIPDVSLQTANSPQTVHVLYLIGLIKAKTSNFHLQRRRFKKHGLVTNWTTTL